MVLKLQPSQVVSLWDLIKYAIVQVYQVPPDKELDYTNKALQAILSGKYECWVIVDDVDGERQILAVAASSVLENEFTGERSVSLDLIYGFRKLSTEIGMDMLEFAKEYARNTGCQYVRALTSNERMKQLYRMTGFNTEQSLITFRV